MLSSAYELPFPAEHLGWYRAERVIHLLEHPAVALAEAHRVLKPGGHIVLLSPDLNATVFSTSTQYAKLARAAVSAIVDVGRPGMGTHFPQWMIEAGFTEVEVVPRLLSLDNVKDASRGILDLALSAAVKTGALTPEQVHVLRDDMTKLSKQGAFVCSMTFFLATGRR